MKIGIIGVGMVGGTLKRWFEKNTKHELRLYDPKKGYEADLVGTHAIFVCIPVDPALGGQNLNPMRKIVLKAKSMCDLVFIKSTVLPGTNDRLGTVSCPEFLTARTCDDDMERLPVIMGRTNQHLARLIFPKKEIRFMANTEAELAKLAHNCAGAFKVTYWNMINDVCEKLGVKYDKVMHGVGVTGYIEKVHTQVPGPDGKLGYGGACFPSNMAMMSEWLSKEGLELEHELFEHTMMLNDQYRGELA